MDVTSFSNMMAVIVGSTAAFVGIGLAARFAWILGTRLQRPRQVQPVVEDARLDRLEHAVDTIAIEVERISEAQRFTVSLLAERLPARTGDLSPERAKAPKSVTPH